MIDPTVYFVPNLSNLDQHELSTNLGVKAVDPDLLRIARPSISEPLQFGPARIECEP